MALRNKPSEAWNERTAHVAQRHGSNPDRDRLRNKIEKKREEKSFAINVKSLKERGRGGETGGSTKPDLQEGNFQRPRLKAKRSHWPTGRDGKNADKDDTLMN